MWRGLRGALSMVLVLGVPLTFPHRDVLVNMTFGVVVVSILFQGTTMSWVLQRLGVVASTDPERGRLELARARLRAARAAAEALTVVEHDVALAGPSARALRGEYERRLADAERELAAVRAAADVHKDEAERVWRYLIETEKASLAEAHRQGLLGEEAYEALVADANARLDQGPPPIEEG